MELLIFHSGDAHQNAQEFASNTKGEVEIMQLQLSPAHPDFGKVGFAELEDRVRKRAYQLYETRGYAHGHALDDWLEAKGEVLGVTRGDTYLENISQGTSNHSTQVERIEV